MLVAIEAPEPDESVTVAGGAIIVHNLVETSPEAVRLAGGSNDPVALVHECLATGAAL